ncbi:MAG: aspartyl protease family protein [Thermofilaceae archaeon]
MGYVRVKALVGSAEGGPCKELSFLVDTGAFYTVIPPPVAEELGIKPYARTRLTLADKRVVEAGVSLAYMKILDREGVLPVAILESPEPLLGATALEGLGLRVDPATGRVEHSRPYGLALL